MLNQIVLAYTIFPYIRHNFPNNIQLMITWKYQCFLFLQIDKLLDNIQHTIFLKYIFPKVDSMAHDPP